jgi:AbrB family looped-hinge helix DNA binding protein
MEVTVSSKYQLVVPKEVRKQLGIKPGQKVRVKQVSGNTITFERQPTMQELLDNAAGSMKDTPWQKEGVDVAVWVRRMRDEEWN